MLCLQLDDATTHTGRPKEGCALQDEDATEREGCDMMRDYVRGKCSAEVCHEWRSLLEKTRISLVWVVRQNVPCELAQYVDRFGTRLFSEVYMDK
jgi:hypothetical protein